MKKSSFYNTDIAEQESMINVDYDNKMASFYTSRKTVYNRMVKEIGEPAQIYYIGKKITGGRWDIDFQDKKINKIFSKKIIVGAL